LGKSWKSVFGFQGIDKTNSISYNTNMISFKEIRKMTTKYLNQDKGKIAFDDQGNGPLVMCIPSMGDVRGEYRFLISQLIAAGYRVVSMDVRGMGGSSIDWNDYSVAGIGKDIIALVRELNAGPAILVGTSMAAGAAVWAAVEAPNLIRGMVLIGPFVRGNGNWFLEILFSVLFARPWGPAMWVKYYSTLYPSRKPANFAEYSAALLENLKEHGRLESLMQMLRASKRASEERIPRVNKPTLVLMGNKDLDFKNPEFEAKWVAEKLKGIYTMIENAGHYPHAEMPDVTGPLILHFLESLSETDQEKRWHQEPA
jgi:pimeloyl-ACP methyl ester carboxylesterase